MKFCSRCGRLLSEDKFNHNRSKPDGLDTYCCDCRRKYMQQYQFQRNNRYSTPESRDRDILAAMKKSIELGGYAMDEIDFNLTEEMEEELSNNKEEAEDD